MRKSHCRISWGRFFLLLAFVCFDSKGAVEAPKSPSLPGVKVDSSKTWGVWEGWGTSLCWMGKVFGARDDVADLLFTKKDVVIAGRLLPGLAFNIVRYNAGACSWIECGEGRRMKVSKNIPSSRQIEGFWTDPVRKDPKDWDWNVDAPQREMMRKARDRGANLFELFSNSPMWWMCANDNPSGAADAKQDNLPVNHYPFFAAYLAAVAKQARDVWGIPFTSVEPFNEASSPYWKADGKQEGCHFSPGSQAAFLPLLREELDRQGLKDLPIAASDENRFDDALAVWEAFTPLTRSLVSKVNVHGYQYEKGARSRIYEEVVVRDRKTLWNSEYGDTDPSGLKMARNIHRDFLKLHPTAWCYWQPLDRSKQWATVHADMERGEILEPAPRHFVMAQYSRHIRPGMTIVDTGDGNTIAALAPDRKLLVLVVLNEKDSPIEKRFDLTALGFTRVAVSSWITETAGTKRHEGQGAKRIQGGIFSELLPPRSVTTFEIVPAT